MLQRRLRKRKRLPEAMKALLESRSFFRALFEFAGVGMVITTVEGEIVRSNDAFQQMSGYPEQELLLRDFSALLRDEDATLFRRISTTLLREKRDFENFVLQMRDSAGSLLYLETTLSCVMNGEGEGNLLVLILNDITGRIQLDQAMERMLRSMTTTLDSLPAGVIVVELETRKILFINDQMRELVDSVESPVCLQELVPVREGNCRRCFHSDPDMPFIDLIRRKGRWYSFKIQKLRWIHGQEAILALYQDTSDLVEAKQNLDETEAMMHAMVHSVNEAIFLLDTEGKIRYINDYSSDLLGLKSDAVRGRSAIDFLDPEIREDRQGVLERVVKSRQERRYETIWGDRWYDMLLSPVLRQDGKTIGLSITARDITSRKQEAEALQKARAEAERLSALRMRFVAAASHDLRQPLQALHLFIEVLLNRLENSAARETAGKVKQSAEALTDLLNSLLDISRLDAGLVTAHPVSFSLRKLLERLSGEYLPLALERDLRFRSDIPEIQLQSDPVLLERILRNLLTNAFQHTHQGGIKLGCRTRSEGVELYVLDTGRGIPQEELHTVFEEFQRGKHPESESSGGLGLGLAIVRLLSALLGFRLSVWSRPGIGSRFSLTIPLARTESRIAPAMIAGEPEPRLTGDFTGLSVLVVEDDGEILDAITELLTQWNCRVTPYSSPREVVESLRSRNIPPDLIVADQSLGQTYSGLETIRLVRNGYERFIPAVLLTAETDPETIMESQRLNCAYLSKPLVARRLHECIRSLHPATAPDHASPYPMP